MDQAIKTIMDSTDKPMFLSEADNRETVFLNSAAQKQFNLRLAKNNRSLVSDIFDKRKIIYQQVAWEYSGNKFTITEERLTINDQDYILSTATPIDPPHQVLGLLQTQKEMAKLLVHIFNSPVNGISGFTELLQALDLSDKQLEYVTSIDKGVDDLKRILSEVNYLAKDIDVHKSRFDLREFIQMIISQFPPEDRRRIKIDVDTELYELQSDYLLLKEIITELLDNALEYGSGETDPVVLEFTDEHVIGITNYGPEIPLDDRDKIFYPFYSSSASGLGLGLSKSIYLSHEMGYDLILAQNSSVHGIRFEVVM